MTDITTPVETTEAKPTGLKAKASEVGLQAYLKAPPPAQNAMLKGFTKAQPVAEKLKPHAKQILGGGLALLLIRKLRRRRRRHRD